MDASEREGRVPKGAAEGCWTSLPQLALPGIGAAPAADGLGAAPSTDRMSRLIRAIEYEIIPRLVDAHRGLAPPDGDAAAASAGSCAAEVEQFAQLVLGNDDEAVALVLRGLRSSGVAVESIFLDLLAPVARRLGWMWDEDLCDFTDVTVGVGRLQQLLRELSPAFGHEAGALPDGRRVLLAAARGEQHTFGLAIVGEFFRRDGWDVVGGIGQTADPVALVHAEWFDVVGLSVGHQTRLAWARELIGGVRRQSRNRTVCVIVGGPVFAVDGLSASAVGADAVVVDGGAAPSIAAGLLDRRLQCP